MFGTFCPEQHTHIGQMNSLFFPARRLQMPKIALFSTGIRHFSLNRRCLRTLDGWLAHVIIKTNTRLYLDKIEPCPLALPWRWVHTVATPNEKEPTHTYNWMHREAISMYSCTCTGAFHGFYQTGGHWSFECYMYHQWGMASSHPPQCIHHKEGKWMTA